MLLAKPEIDTKGAGHISSRLGVERPVDFLIGRGDDVRALVAAHGARYIGAVACLLIDEAQFLSPEQVDDLLRLVVEDGIPVLAYGIRTDFRTRAFPGSARLMEVSHSLEELKTICRCGRKALFNARLVGGRFVFDGDQVAIDDLDHDQVTYESLCAQDYLLASGGRLS